MSQHYQKRLPSSEPDDYVTQEDFEALEDVEYTDMTNNEILAQD